MNVQRNGTVVIKGEFETGDAAMVSELIDNVQDKLDKELQKVLETKSTDAFISIEYINSELDKETLEKISSAESFINDEEKMADFMEMDMDSFLESYSYLTEEEYIATLRDVVEKEDEAGLSFISDEEKMVDFDELSKSNFLASYSYLTEEEYDATGRAALLDELAPAELTVAITVEVEFTQDLEYYHGTNPIGWGNDPDYDPSYVEGMESDECEEYVFDAVEKVFADELKNEKYDNIVGFPEFEVDDVATDIESLESLVNEHEYNEPDYEPEYEPDYDLDYD